MTDEFEYHNNKKPEKTYISKSLTFSNQKERRLRIASKVFNSEKAHEFVEEKGECVIRVTPGGKQEIVAKFYEDNRGIFTLTIQRFTTKTGFPHKTHFSFVGEEVEKILEFINNLKLVNLSDKKNINITDAELRKMILSAEQASRLIAHNQELVIELAKSEITTEDIVALGYRRKELDKFNKLLNDIDFFEKERRGGGYKNSESIWQAFFEKNPWIFGYGLSFIFLSTCDEKKLEQVIKGFDFSNIGKRVDALMKTSGIINSLCFVEIKTHLTELLSKAPYRSGCWSASKELAGAVSQVQGTVSIATETLKNKLEMKDKKGDLTGEQVFNYHPRSFLVIGNLAQFKTDKGVNEERYRSFELFRKNLSSPEIITFDELYSRANFIVNNGQGK